jgi:hypothetical protein
MAMSVTVDEKVFGKMDVADFTFVSETDGSASGSTTQRYTGQVRQVLIYAGTTAPTNLYDVQLQDGAGRDLLFGDGANCPVADVVVVENAGIVVNDRLTLAVTNAGDTKDGKVVVFIEE